MGAQFLRINNLHAKTGDKEILKGLTSKLARVRSMLLGPKWRWQIYFGKRFDGSSEI